MTLFAGLRGNVGTDTFAYKSFFNSFGTDKLNISTFEPVFVFYAYLIHLIWANDQFFIFIISITTGTLIYYNLKLIEEKTLFLLFYLTTYYIMFNLNLMRFGIGVLLISYPFLLNIRGEKPKIGLYFLGFLTHFATLFTLLIIIQKKHIVKATLFFTLFFLFLGNLLLEKFKSYLFLGLISIGKFHLDFGLLLEIVMLSLLFWINRKDIKRGFVFLFLIYILLRNLTFIFEMLQRFAYLTGFLIYANFFSKKLNLYSRLLIIVFIFFNLYRSLMFINNSDNAINDLIAEYPGFSSLYSQTRWLPFKFFW
ncbi:MAG: EpsG family protein [Ferruginibacter sp.]|nr:EpsG family protein [Ferruginibacter sp.]